MTNRASVLVSSSRPPVPGSLYTGLSSSAKTGSFSPLRTLYGLGLVLTSNKMIRSRAYHDCSTPYAWRSLVLKPDMWRSNRPHDCRHHVFLTSRLMVGTRMPRNSHTKNAYTARTCGKRRQYLPPKILKANPFSSSSLPTTTKRLIGSLQRRGMHLPYGIAPKL